MMKRLLCGLVALSPSLWQVAPAYAGHNEAVSTAQTPAYTGDTSKAAGSGVTVTNTVKGKTVLPIDGTTAMTGGLQGVGGNFLAVPSATTWSTESADFEVRSGPNAEQSTRVGGLPIHDVIRGVVTNGTGNPTTGAPGGVNAGLGQVAAGNFTIRGLVDNKGGNGTTAPNGYSVALASGATCEVTNCIAWGFNPSVSDIGSDRSSTAVGNISGRTIEIIEADANVFSTTTVVTGINMVGNMLTGSTSSTFGYTLSTVSSSQPPWAQGYSTNAGAAVSAFVSGPAAWSGKNVNSQSTVFNFFDGAGNISSMNLQALSGTAAGNVLALQGNAAGFRAPNLFLPAGGQFQVANQTAGQPAALVLSQDASNKMYLSAPAGLYLQSSLAPQTAGGVQLGSGSLPFASVSTQALSVVGGASISNGSFTDPASGTAYDAKFGGPGAGIAVAGPSLFNGSLTAGSLNTPGNASVGGNLNIGSQLYTTTGTLYIQYSNNTGGVNINGQGGPTSIGGVLSIAGITSLSNTNTSTSATTGALQVAGGVGMAKDLFVGGAANISGTATAGNLVTTGLANLGTVNVSGVLTLQGNGGAEIGSLTTAGTPFLDFHSSGSNNDFDARIIASGGTSGTVGKGSLSLNAGSVSINATLQAASLATSGGTVKGTLCVDTSGNVYVKTTTGACL